MKGEIFLTNVKICFFPQIFYDLKSLNVKLQMIRNCSTVTSELHFSTTAQTTSGQGE